MSVEVVLSVVVTLPGSGDVLTPPLACSTGRQVATGLRRSIPLTRRSSGLPDDDEV
jgi:hypothetical protein